MEPNIKSRVNGEKNLFNWLKHVVGDEKYEWVR
jgi:hypothetical protein